MRASHLVGIATIAAAIAAVVTAACGGFATDDPQQPDGGSFADPLDSGPAFCDPRAPFKRVDRLSSISSAGLLEGRPSLTLDERSIFFQHRDPSNADRIYSATRAQLANDFGAPAELAELRAFSDQHGLQAPAVTGDAGALVFGAQDGGDVDLWVTTRTPGSNLFRGEPNAIDTVNGASIDRGPAFSADNTRLYFSSSRMGPFREEEDQDSIFMSPILQDGTFGAPIALKDATTSNGLLLGYNPTPSADGKYLYFARRAAGTGDHIFVSELTVDGVTNPQAIIATAGTTFTTIEANEYPGFISPDHCRLYFASDALGDGDLYVASRH